MGNMLCLRNTTQDTYNPASYSGGNATILIQPQTNCISDTAFIRYARPDGGIEGVFGFVQTQYAAATADFVIQGSSCGYSEKFRIAGNNVGIGTSSPASRLHIYSTTTNDGLQVENTLRNISCFKSTGEHSFMYIDSAHQCIYLPAVYFLRAGTLYAENRLQRASNSDALGSYTESEGVIGTTGNTPFSIQSCGTRRIHLTTSGRVGIGTISPSTLFQVCGNISAENIAWVQNTNSNGYGSLRALNDANNAAVFGVGGSAVGTPYANNGYLYTDPTVNFVFAMGGTERMRILCTGNIGIACSSPGSKLTVGGTVTATDTITTTSGTVNTIVSWNASVGIIGTDTNHGLQIRTCGTERIRVTCAGCVGIGTTTPSYNLHVNGTFYAAGSSQEYKEGICKYDTDSCMFMKLKPVTYQYKDEFKHLGKELKSQTQIGLIAEEVAEVAPELAILVKENDNDVVRNVDYEKLTIVLLSEVQKLRKELDDLKTK